MFKISINAGHGYKTAGKRCLRTIDPNETKEYILNKRVCDILCLLLCKYEGITIQRIDNGEDESISQRAKHANNFGADFYLSIHHNAGACGSNAGGVECYCYTKVNNKTKKWQKELYDCVIKETKNKGNRAEPLRYKDLGELRETKMPAVLIECGYMDSVIDTPKILTNEYATQVAVGCLNAIVKMTGIKLKGTAVKPSNNVKKKTDYEIALEVIQGKYGNGNARKINLQNIGRDYKTIQNRVNQILGAKK